MNKEFKVTDLKEGAAITVSASKGTDRVEFETETIKKLDDCVLLKAIECNGKYVGFGSNLIIVVTAEHDPLPLRFSNVRLDTVRYQKEVYTRMTSDSLGKEVNRRRNFRVFIGEDGIAQMGGNKSAREIIVRDVSNNGFSFVVKEEVDTISPFVRITYKDNGKTIILRGRIVRKVVQQEDKVLYGCRLLSKPEGLGKYLNEKQMEKMKDIKD